MKINYIIFILSLFFSFAALADQEQDVFYKAYNTCSNYSQSATKMECNFGVIYKESYQDCMYKNGYRENDDLDPEQYKKYMESYSYCSSRADVDAKQQCNYNSRYNVYYNQCMLKYGYNEEGEKVSPYFQFEY